MKHPWSLFLFFVWCILFFSRCAADGINDKTKRNIHWAWWIDSKTGNGQWIPLSNTPTWQNGTYTKFYYNGIELEKGTIRNGRNVDTTFFYDIQGKFCAYRTQQDSSSIYYLHDGPIKIYRPDGRIKAEGLIRDHTIKDKWTEYFEYGKVHILFDFKSDTGWESTYYENGNIQDSSFRVGKESYLIKAWYDDGKLKSEVGWKNYEFFAEQLHYFENGQLKEKIPLSDGKPDGKVTDWYPTGKIKTIVYFKNGLKNGAFIAYYESGQIKLIGNNKYGKYDGEFKSFGEKGELHGVVTFKDGEKIN